LACRGRSQAKIKIRAADLSGPDGFIFFRPLDHDCVRQRNVMQHLSRDGRMIPRRPKYCFFVINFQLSWPCFGHLAPSGGIFLHPWVNPLDDQTLMTASQEFDAQTKLVRIFIIIIKNYEKRHLNRKEKKLLIKLCFLNGA
jgi:hypothetical protein